MLLWPEFFAVRAMEAVKFEGEERDVAKEIRRQVKEGQVDDSVAAAVGAL